MKFFTFLLTFLLLLISFWFNSVEAADCAFNGNIWSSLDGCLSDSDLVDASGPTLIEWNVKNQIVNWTTALATFLALVSVGAIVYGAFLMTISLWDDERIKKWKDVVKWSILWFLAIVVTWALIRIIVEVIFSFTS